MLFKSGIMEALHQLGLTDAVYGKLYSYLFGWEPRGVVLHQVKISIGAGSDCHGESCRCGAGICTPDRLQEHAAGASACQRGHHPDGIEVYHPRNSPEDKGRCCSV